MDILIREADFGDAACASGIVDVLNSYAQDTVGGGIALTEDVRQRLVPALRDHPNALVLVASSDRKYVGVAVCFEGLSTFVARPLLNIHDLAVMPEYRGQGIGRALLREAETVARDRGCCKLTLEVQDDNAPARGLYRKFGFTDFVIGDSSPTRFLEKRLHEARESAP